MAGFRGLKKLVRFILAAENWQNRLPELRNLAADQPQHLCGTLFSLLLDPDEDVRWRAAEGFAEVIPVMAENNLESARIVIRQMMWRLNEESGNIGWGTGEAMGVALGSSDRLAREYHSILVSYVQKLDSDICHGNFIDNPTLRHGVLWGVARLAKDQPALMVMAEPVLLAILNPSEAMEGLENTNEGLECHDAQSRGLACWGLGFAGTDVSIPALESMTNDNGSCSVFRNGQIEQTTVRSMASEALLAVRKRVIR